MIKHHRRINLVRAHKHKRKRHAFKLKYAEQIIICLTSLTRIKYSIFNICFRFSLYK